MKSKIMYAAIGLAIVITAAGAILAADMKPGDIFKELRTEMTNYRNAEIFPEMSAWKTQLDNAMSPEDLEKLNDLRKKAAEFRDKRRSEMTARMKNRKGRGDFDKKEMKERRKEGKEEMKAIAEELKPLAEKYSSTLKEIAEAAKPKAKEWKNEMRNIHENWRDSHEDELDAMKEKMDKKHPMMRKRMKKMKKEMRRHKGMAFNFDNKRAIGRFMLWDGTKTEIDEELPTPGPNHVEEQANVINDLRNYPNPFSEKTKIYFTLEESLTVSLTVIDNMGNTISTLYYGKLDKGEHTFEFNANNSEHRNLSAGTYIYELSAGNISKTGKMSLNR